MGSVSLASSWPRGALRELNPRVDVEVLAQNITPGNVAALVARADVLVDAAPLFEERLLLNQHAVALNKPMVECAMYELQAQITTILPHQSPCLACLYPEIPPSWKRQFPVFGAVAGMIGAWARWKPSSSSPDSVNRWPVASCSWTCATVR